MINTELKVGLILGILLIIVIAWGTYLSFQESIEKIHYRCTPNAYKLEDEKNWK